jgi:hypothetical protein
MGFKDAMTNKIGSLSFKINCQYTGARVPRSPGLAARCAWSALFALYCVAGFPRISPRIERSAVLAITKCMSVTVTALVVPGAVNARMPFVRGAC